MSDVPSTMENEVASCVDHGVGHLRATQHAEGYWLGAGRSLSLLCAYGTALIAAGREPSDPRLQEVCTELESFARPDGGFSHVPEAESQPGVTHDVVLLLRRCKPRSTVLPRAEAFLRSHGGGAPSPLALFHRWLLAPDQRDEVLAFRPPAAVLHRVAARHIAPRLFRSMFGEKSSSPKRPGWLARTARDAIGLWYVWPVPGEIDRATYPNAPPTMLRNLAAMVVLQTAAGDRPLGRDRDATIQAVVPFLERYLDEDRSFYDLLSAAPMVECLRALGRHEDASALARQIDRIEYLPGGWLRSTMIATNVMETALAVPVLMDHGIAKDDPAVENASKFLHEARNPAGLWSWSWEQSCGPRGHRDTDSDDSAAALLALRRAESLPGETQVADIIRTIFAFQQPNGAFATMDPAAWAVSPEMPSNTARCLLALVALGVERDDPRVKRATDWLLAQQRADGTWFDFSLPAAPYGTVMALEALVELGYRVPGDLEVERGLHFLKRTQNADGGWGFDWHGARVSSSTVEHTALAVIGLCRFSRARARPIHAVEGGVRFLLRNQAPDGSWPGAHVCNYNGWEGYATTHYANVVALHALAAYRDTQQRHLATAKHLVRARRTKANRAAAATD